MPPQVPRRRGAALTVGAALALAALAACASSSNRSGPTHAVQVSVVNNLQLPADLSVYAQAPYSASRILLGDVPPGQTRTLSFTPVSYTETYRLIATRVPGRPIRSQPFTVGSEMTGLIVWRLFPNIIGFEDLPDSSATDTAPPPHKGP